MHLLYDLGNFVLPISRNLIFWKTLFYSEFGNGRAVISNNGNAIVILICKYMWRSGAAVLVASHNVN